MYGCCVLDVFAYMGGFSVVVGLGGVVEVVMVDLLGLLFEVVVENLIVNGLLIVGLREVDAFVELRCWCDVGERFDLIVFDLLKLVARVD